MASKAYSGEVKRLYHQRKLVKDLSREPGLLRSLPLFNKLHTMALLRPDLTTTLVKGTLSGRVLEVGIGAGPLTKRLLREKGISEIHGVDVSAPLLAKARERGAKPAVGTGESLPFKPNSFDSAMCIDTIGHIENPLGFVREIRKALRPGGRVVLSVSERGMLSGAIAEEARARGLVPFGSFSRQEIEDIVRSSGLRVEKSKKVLYFPYMPRKIFVYARKPEK